MCSRAGSDGYKSFGRYSPWLLFEPQLIEQSSKGRASLKSRDSYWGYTYTDAHFVLINPIMKEYNYCDFPPMMLRQWVPLDLMLTSEVQSAI